MDAYYFQRMLDEVQETEYMRKMFVVFNGLKGELKKEGNQWCAITGEMPEHYLAGFADTPDSAMRKWYAEYCQNKS